MNQFSDLILDLLKESAALANEARCEALAEATVGALDAMGKDGLIGMKDAWVYQSIIHGMVESGALKVEGQDMITPRTSQHA
jgi:hypothetical protein